MPGYPHMMNLLFAIPLTGRPIPPDVVFAFHAMATPMNYNFSMLRIQGKPVDEARNDFAEYAVQNDCKYIFFWDEDVACPPQTIPELVYKMEHHPEAAVIGGVYCLKRNPPEPLVFRGNGNGPFWDWKAGEFFEVTGLGMGCTLLRTEVFKDLKKPWFKTEVNYSRMLDGNGGLETWTEDLWFCERVTSTNKWKIYCDSSIICSHYDMTTCKPFDLPPDSKPVQHMAKPKGKKKILSLGCGAHPYETSEGKSVTVDPDEKNKPDYRCDLTKLPFATGEFDIVFSPALEHFSDPAEVLPEWSRVLKPGGELRLVISSADWIRKELAAGRFGLKSFYGNGNKTLLEKEELKKSLEDQGFTGVELADSDMAHIAIRGVKT